MNKHPVPSEQRRFEHQETSAPKDQKSISFFFKPENRWNKNLLFDGNGNHGPQPHGGLATRAQSGFQRCFAIMTERLVAKLNSPDAR